MNSIEVKNLKKYFGDTKAVDDISFDVKKGEIMGFLGENGAGKTTTIRSMLDLLKFDAGEIKILGKDSVKNSVEIKKQIGFLSGEVRLYKRWTGVEHIRFIEGLKSVDKSSSEEIAEQLKLDITKQVKNLSSGNKQKLAFILTLIGDPKVLILDEPTNSLDPLLQLEIYQILKERAQAGTTVFMSSHVLSEVEKVCDRVIILKKGKIVATENVEELRHKRVYQVHVSLGQAVDSKDFNIEGVEVISHNDNHIHLKVKKDVSKLFGLLAKQDVKDIEISKSNIEDVFLEYYK